MKKILYYIIITSMIFISIGKVYSQTQIAFNDGTVDSKSGYSVAISGDGHEIVSGSPDFDNGRGYLISHGFDGYSWSIRQGGNDFSSLLQGVTGVVVDLSDDGNIVAFRDFGYVKIYSWNGQVWNQLGNSIQTSALALYDVSLALSGDGNTIVFGDDTYNSSNGKVAVYHLVSGSWQMKGSIFNGINAESLGVSVDVNDDGSVIAMGSTAYPNSNSEGRVQIYNWSGNSWVQEGFDITSPINNIDRFGENICLNANGDRIGITSALNALIYKNYNSSWSQIGSTINFSTTNGAKSISLSSDGSVFAIGEPQYMENGSLYKNGKARLFRIDDYGIQNQVGNQVEGDDTYTRLGFDISVTNDGYTVFIGAPNFNDSYPYSYPNVGYTVTYLFPEPCQWVEEPNYELLGDNSHDQFGRELAYSANGNFLAVSSPYDDTNGNSSGQVKVFFNNGNTWIQRGLALNGEASNDKFGYSVDISDNGNILAVGAIHNDGGGSNAGHVRVFIWNGTNYIQNGPDINGVANSDYLGYSVSLSGNGQLLAVGSPYNDDDGWNKGKVQVYVIFSGGQVPLFSPIYGEGLGDYSGKAVALSSDGMRLLIGSPNNDTNGSNSGQVRVYYRSGINFFQMGQDINGEASNDYSGASLTVNATGSIIAIGANGNDGGGSNSGHVRVYYAAGNQQWTQAGPDIDGEYYNNHFGGELDMTSSGLRLAIGAYNSNSNGSAAGKVQVFDWGGSSWVQEDNDIIGESSYDQAGRAVKISGNGTSVIVGAPLNDNSYSNAGQVRLFETCSSNTKSLSFETFDEELAALADQYNQKTSIADDIVTSQLVLYPNPVQNELSWIVESVTILQVQVFNMQGQVVLTNQADGNSVDVSELTSGAYFIKLSSDKEIFQKKFMKK